MKCGHLVTVGTSLLNNDGGGNDSNFPDRYIIVNDLNELCGELKNKNIISGATVDRNRDTIVKKIQQLKPCTELNYRKNQSTANSPRDRLPQELSYLWRFAQDRPANSKRDLVRLLASDTAECKNCALVIAAVLKTSPWNKHYEVYFDVDKNFAKGVNPDDGSTFAAEGMHSWMGKIQDIIDFLKDKAQCDRIYLNVTGGYKGTVPYSTLIGMLNQDKVELGYLFEESIDIIRIPTYPVGLDFRQWHENALRLRMAKEAGSLFIPDEAVNNLLDKNTRDLSRLGKVLEKRYEQQEKVDPLKMYSINIIDRLLNRDQPGVGLPQSEEIGSTSWTDEEKNEVPTLRKILHKLIDKVGDIIWLGDKIPGVEHAKRHHHNLLEFTELFLTPILNKSPLFLNARERFVLLSAVMLHDCGHSHDRISVKRCQDLKNIFGDINIGVDVIGEELLLFISDVRDYHQYLAGLRLNDPQTAFELNWPGKKGFKEKELPEKLHDAVILTCLYHRKRMGYDKDNSEKGMLHLTGQNPGTLKEHELAKEILEEPGVDLLKIVALLRLIDGCDSQARRAGSTPLIDLSLSLLEQDYRSEAMRAKQAYQSFEHITDNLNNEWLNQADEALKHPIEDEPWKLEDKNNDVRLQCLKILNNGMQHNKEEQAAARIWLIAAEAADRAQMSYKQFPHYMKHRAIQEIRVLPDDNLNSGFNFNIILCPNTSNEVFEDPYSNDKGTIKDFWLEKELFTNDNGCPEALSKTIESEISNEYSSVSAYVQKHYGLKVTYWWEDEWENEKNGSNGKPFYP